MKMSERILSWCVSLLLVLTYVSAVKQLKTIKQLKKIDFGQFVPKHSLILLHWFANTVEIDNNNVIQLTFNPNSDYGSHHYGNYERLLDPLPRGYRYYTVGNLNEDMLVQLPNYVVHPPMEYEGGNRDRIIFRAHGQRIDQVYITQHYDVSEHQGTPYDQDHTYQITINLLRQIREFSVRDGQRPLAHLRNRYASNADDGYIRHTWGNLACLGLFLFIVIEEKHLLNQCNNRPKNNKPEANNRPHNNKRAEHNNRPENDKSWEVNNCLCISRQTCCYAFRICCILILIFVFIVFWAIRR